MARMTPVQLGVALCALCLITQVWSQSTATPGNFSVPGNATVNANSTMATGTYGGPVNATTPPAGTAVQSQANTFSVLIAVAMTTGLLHPWC